MLLCFVVLSGICVCYVQGRNEGGTIPQPSNHYEGAEWLQGAPKSPNNVTCTFFNTLHLLPKKLRFEHGAPNLLLATCAI